MVSSREPPDWVPLSLFWGTRLISVMPTLSIAMGTPPTSKPLTKGWFCFEFICSFTRGICFSFKHSVAFSLVFWVCISGMHVSVNRTYRICTSVIHFVINSIERRGQVFDDPAYAVLQIHTAKRIHYSTHPPQPANAPVQTYFKYVLIKFSQSYLLFYVLTFHHMALICWKHIICQILFHFVFLPLLKPLSYDF